jgi:peptidyl-prolyl cis-trans isomerase B (cyclophilin B)
MKKITFLLLLSLSCLAAPILLKAQTFTGKPQYNIEVKRADTVMGNIVVEMFPAIAPNHVRNWDSLVSIKFFDSIAFHRVIPGFMIQGGDPNSRHGARSTWGYGDPSQVTVDAEFNSVSHRRGILSAARDDDPNSANSQFFICVANYSSLDKNYSAYGKVVSGMSVADSIVKSKRDANDNPLDKISMFITKLGSNDSVTAVPKLVFPLTNAFTITNAQLRWNKVGDAMMYRVQVATDSQFQNIFLDSSMRQIDTSVRVKNLTELTTYYWRVLANNGGNESPYSAIWNFTVESLSTKSENNFAIEFDVYPNPIKENTTIGFNLSKPSNVTLSVLDILGRNVLTLIDSKLLPTGKNEVPFTRGALPSGVYIYRLEAEGTSITKRVILE